MGDVIDIDATTKAGKKTKLSDGTSLSPADLSRLNKINKAYTHANIGGKNIIVSQKYCQVQGVTFSFQTQDEFKKSFLHEEKIGVEKKKNPASAWLEWGGKSYKPSGTGFYPMPEKCPKGVFNFYQGFRVKPKQGDCTIYLNHLKNVICNGDLVAYEYLIGWLAHLFQKPDEKPNVAIVLKSVEGTGKGAMIEPVLQILGIHGNKTNGAYALAGRFNGLIANKLLIFSDEVDLTDKHVADKLKGIITETTVNLERKGLEIEPLPNFCRLIFASNHARVLNAGKRERRYLVLEPSEAKAQDTDYFKALWNWTHNGGAERLLNFLLSVDISAFNPYKCPQTAGLIDEKLANLRGIDRYFYEEITKPEPFGGAVRLLSNELVSSFMAYSVENEEKISKAQARSYTGKVMARLKIPVLGRSDRGTGKFYELPEAHEIKSAFADYLDIPIDRMEH